MSDFLVGLALVLVIEGFLYAAFPEAMKRVLEQVRDMPPQVLRVTGLGGFVIGVGIVWLVRR
ncbi:Putative inner membrane protein YjeT (clustered with HflC) [hydrothermal vent metagenome]|uniref:Inner membrane protein YjeT (Clustered with HflC) n=1 Tax=hydrothermal vent metagenome TaxID=652676 RepID=A0A3B0TMN7_9ZZZZ